MFGFHVKTVVNGAQLTVTNPADTLMLLRTNGVDQALPVVSLDDV